MLTLCAAVSHNPFMYRPADQWERLSEYVLAGRPPHPVALADETAFDEYRRRIDHGFDELKRWLTGSAPSAIVVLCSDDGRLFSGVQVPQFCTYLGEEAWVDTRLAEAAETDERRLTLPCQQELAAFLHRELVAAEFDMSYASELKPRGAPPSMAEPIVSLGYEATPIVPLFVNAHVDPAPSGRRCYALGAAIAKALRDWPEHVMLLASGGLSHDYRGPRAGWIDQPLDRWLLERIERGQGSNLGSLYDVDSDSIQGGAAEMRLWTVAAGAAETLHAKATVIDYFPFHTASAGTGLAVWQLTS